MSTHYNDINRLRALLSYDIMDTPAESFYDDLASLVAIICQTPIAIISFLDDRRQWYKAKIGMPQTELPLAETICQYTLNEADILEISDTKADSRLDGNPHVYQENGVRFYAGTALRSEDGYPIGTVCIADLTPRSLNASQKEALRIITRQIMQHLESRRQNKNMSHELQNILQQKISQAEKELDVRETAYNNLLQAIAQSNALAEFLPDGTLLSVNAQFEAVMGYTVDELIANNDSLLPSGFSPLEKSQFWQALQSGKACSGTYQYTHKNGNPIWVISSFSPVLDADNEVIRITQIAQNLTSEMLERNALEELSRQKDAFIANISHELRTPLHAIIGLANVLREQEQNREKCKQIDTIRTASSSLLNLVNGILDLSKIEAGLFLFDPVPFHLNTLVEDASAILLVKARQKHLHFAYHIAPDVPLLLIGDKNRLHQVLMNLIDNAIKFTETGFVQLSISHIETNEEGHTLLFRVQDTGIGIAADKLNSIFGRFTQAEQHTMRQYGGTGLGLNICKLLVEKQGGTIYAESTPGAGATFSFTLTFGIATTTDTTNDLLMHTNEPKRNGRILMCEDNEMVQYLSQKLFELTDIHLDIVANGKLGIERLKTHRYDLILMDIQMPEMDGYETTRYIREEMHSNIPIIAMTAYSMTKEKLKCLSMGMNDYLSKPFDKKELMEKIALWLPKEQALWSADQLQEYSGGDPGFEKEILGLFLSNSPLQINAIDTALQQGAYRELAQVAHKLKSSFGMLGADTQLLQQLEDSPEAAGQWIAALRAQTELLQEQIRNYITDQ